MDDIIKNRMKIILENDNNLIGISLDINNYKKIKNQSKLSPIERQNSLNEIRLLA